MEKNKRTFLGANKVRAWLIVLSAVLITSAITVVASPPGAPFNPGATLNPFCAPGDTNCTVVAPVVSTRNIGTTLPLTGGGDLTTDRTLSIGGLSSFGTANFLLGVNPSATGWEYKPVVVNSVGNMGIGTTTPWARLSVDTSSLVVGIPSFVVGSSTRTDFVVTQAGNVGIGRTVPTTRLDITNFATSSPVISLRDPLGNVSLELRAGTSTLLNTFVGLNAGGLNITGNSNTAIGRDTLFFNTTGSDNTAVGLNTLQSNTAGNFNTAIGRDTLFSNTTGSDNTAVGSGALVFNTTGNNNTAVGLAALLLNTSATNTVAIGFEAGRGTANYSNQESTYIGFQAGRSASTGSNNNTLIGALTGFDITTGASNTLLGRNTGRGITTGSNNTILGANVTGLSSTLSNNIIIADGSGNRRINVDSLGNLGLGTTTPQFPLSIFSATTPQLSLSAGAGIAQWTMRNAGGNLFFSTTTIAGTATTSPSALTILNNGNVGIGTDNPKGLLTLWSNSFDSPSLNLISHPGLSGQPRGRISFWQGSEDVEIARIQARSAGNNSRGVLVFSTCVLSPCISELTERMRITDNGNIGISTTTPWARLSVDTSSLATNVPSFVVGSSTRTDFVVTQAGNIGIGTTTPFARLSVNSVAGEPAFIVGSSTATSFIVDAQGRVGIGRTAPASILDITNFATSSPAISLRDPLGNVSLELRAGTSTLNSIFIGLNSGSVNTVGGSNTALGRSALSLNTSGSINTAMGFQALGSNTTGASNTALGSNALLSNTTGHSNTALGRDALLFNTTGSSNTTLGLSALRLNTTGSQNVAIGDSAGVDYNNIASELGNNVFIGFNTGRGITTGLNNTILGANVTGLSSTLSNNIIIADGSGNQRINVDSLGNIGIGTTTPQFPLSIFSATAPQLSLSAGAGVAQWTMRNAGGNLFFSTTTIAGTATTSPSALTILGGGNVGVGTNAPLARLHIAGTVRFSSLGTPTDDRAVCGVSATGEILFKNAVCTVSSLRYKENIESLGYGLEEIMRLNPVSFRYINADNEGRTERRIGLIAEEVDEVIPEVVFKKDGVIDSVDYPNLVALNIKAIQELNLKIEELTSTTTPTPDSFADKLFQNLFAKIRVWMGETTNGIRSIFVSEKICIDGECLTADDIRALKSQIANNTNEESPTPVSVPEVVDNPQTNPEEQTPVEETPEDTTTEEVGEGS